MRILVTGHLGYIGVEMTSFLLGCGHEIVGLDNDLYSECDFLGAPDPVPSLGVDLRDVTASDLDGFDAVVHLAAMSNDPLGDLNPRLTYEVNRDASVRLAEAAKAAGVGRFLFSSSCSLYGKGGDYELAEDAAFNPVTPYGHSKIEVERALSLLADESFSPVYLRNATAYGLSRRLRADIVVNNLVGHAVTTGKVMMQSDGSPWRPLVHILDIAHAFAQVLIAPRSVVHDQAFNVGRVGENYRVREIADLVAEVVPHCSVSFAAGATADIRDYRVDFSKIERELPGYSTAVDGPSRHRTAVDGIRGRRHDRRTVRGSPVLPHPDDQGAHRPGRPRHRATAGRTTMTVNLAPGVDVDATAIAAQRIPIAGPWVTDLEVRYVAEAAANDWYGNAGQSVAEFEREFADYVGVDHAAAVPHGTAGLHLATLALDIGPGDEVIVPESTWVASAAPIVYAGATPVFADVDPDTWCISATSLEERISPRTKAIVTVDLYGGVPDMAAVRAVAAGIPIIEDAAQAIGATLEGVPAGRLGDIGVFSFHGTKTMTTGEGGMVVTNRSDLFDRVSRLRDHGRSAGNHKYFVTDEIGYKYRMSSLAAAFGRAQLSRIDELVEKKKQIFRWYETRLADLPGIRLNVEPRGVANTFWMVTVVVDQSHGLTTRQMMASFDRQGIDTRPFLPPLSSLSAFSKHGTKYGGAEHNPIAYDIAARAINLPSALAARRDAGRPSVHTSTETSQRR